MEEWERSEVKKEEGKEEKKKWWQFVLTSKWEKGIAIYFYIFGFLWVLAIPTLFLGKLGKSIRRLLWWFPRGLAYLIGKGHRWGYARNRIVTLITEGVVVILLFRSYLFR